MPPGMQWPTDAIAFGALAWRFRNKIGFHPFIDWETHFMVLLVECECEPPDHDCGPRCVCWEMEET